MACRRWGGGGGFSFSFCACFPFPPAARVILVPPPRSSSSRLPLGRSSVMLYPGSPTVPGWACPRLLHGLDLQLERVPTQKLSCRGRRAALLGAALEGAEPLSHPSPPPPARTQQRLRKCRRPPRRPSSQARMPGQTQPSPCCSHKGPLCPPAALPTPQGPQTPPCGLRLPEPAVELGHPLPSVFPRTPGPLVPEVGDPNLWWVPRRF